MFKSGNKEKKGVLTNSGTSRPRYKGRKDGRSLIVKQDQVIMFKKSGQGQTYIPIKKRQRVSFVEPGTSEAREEAHVKKTKEYQGVSARSKGIIKKPNNYQNLENGFR